MPLFAVPYPLPPIGGVSFLGLGAKVGRMNRAEYRGPRARAGSLERGS